MELTPEEEKLLNAFREVDRQNPAGIDNFTTAFYIDHFTSVLSGLAAEAGRRYRLFLSECEHKPLVDLTEAQRSKKPFEDLRATPEDKAHYERIYKQSFLPPPIWKTGAP